MNLKSWQHHIRHTHVRMTDKAWCGANLSSWDWAYVSIDHATLSAPRDRIQPCPACVKAVIRSLKGIEGPDIPPERPTETLDSDGRPIGRT